MIDPSTATIAETLLQTEFDRVRECPSGEGQPVASSPSLRIALEPDDVKKGLGRLILTVVELLRELLERQAMRRIDGGSLAEVEIERLGVTFLQLSEQMDVVKSALGLAGEDLNLDLGPLGTLLGDGRGNLKP